MRLEVLLRLELVLLELVLIGRPGSPGNDSAFARSSERPPPGAPHSPAARQASSPPLTSGVLQSCTVGKIEKVLVIRHAQTYNIPVSLL